MDVLPGDILALTHATNLKLGPGLQQLPLTTHDSLPFIIATRAGTLRSSGRNKYLVESNGQRVSVAQHSIALRIHVLS